MRRNIILSLPPPLCTSLFFYHRFSFITHAYLIVRRIITIASSSIMISPTSLKISGPGTLSFLFFFISVNSSHLPFFFFFFFLLLHDSRLLSFSPHFFWLGVTASTRHQQHLIIIISSSSTLSSATLSHVSRFSSSSTHKGDAFALDFFFFQCPTILCWFFIPFF